MWSQAARAAQLFLVLVVAAVAALVAVVPHADAAYPGRDGRIAFVRANQVYTMSSTGTGVKKLTTSGKNYRPKWSPDGSRISFIHEAQGRTDVWVMSATGGNKRAVTDSGDVTSAGASWSPDGKLLAFATDQLQTIRSTAPYGSSVPRDGLPTGGFCDGDGTLGPVYVDRFVAWSPTGTRIAVFDHSDCYFDDRIDMFYPGTQELRQYAALGADCCGYTDWTDLFWGPSGQFGYSERDLGPYGEDEDAPSRIIYAGFRSHDGDTGGAPSPSGKYLALTNASSGTARIFRANADGTGRRALTTGYQPDWRPLR
jgi:Tol biopolymer transport system component